MYAETLPEPGCFAISADVLSVKAAIDQSYYVINSSSNSIPIGERVGNHQSSHVGYRVEAIYRFCDCLSDVRVRWTHIPKFKDKNSVSGSSLFGVFTSPQAFQAGSSGKANLTENFNVFALDMLLGHALFDFCHFRFLFQGGMQYGYANFFEEAIFFTNQVGVTRPRIVRNSSRVLGFGPNLGIDFSYKIYKWFGLTGRASGALLIADRKTSLFDNGTLTGPIRRAIEIVNSNYWVVIPTTDVRLGCTFRNPIDFRKWFGCSPLAALGCLKLDFEVGYEIISFYNAVNRIHFTDDASPGTSTDELMDLTLHGPYLHLGLNF